jgi:glycosyltransferase involved in cell wall biosynthesis
MLARAMTSAGLAVTLIIPCSRGLTPGVSSRPSREVIDGIEVRRVSNAGSYGHTPGLGLGGTLRLFLLRLSSLFRSLAVLHALLSRGLRVLYLYQPTFYDGVAYWLFARCFGLIVVGDYCDLSFVEHDRVERNWARRIWALNYRWGMTWLPRRLNRSFVVSRYLMDELGRTAGRNRLGRVPPVVDTSQFDVDPSADFLQVRCGVSSRRVVLYAGSFFDNEGVPILLEAAPAVLSRHPDVRFVVLGSHPAEALGFLRKEAVRLGVAHEVAFPGLAPSRDMPLYFRAAAILVAPKTSSVLNRAGFPVKLVEYLASGRPVVASAVGDIPLAAEDGREALLVPPEDPEALASAISRLFDDPELAQRIGEAGRGRVRRDFDVGVVGDHIRRELERLLADRAHDAVT